MLDDLEDFRTAWNTQPTTLFRMTPREMRAGLERIDHRQRRIARGIRTAFICDLISFTVILFFIYHNVIAAAGCIWIMLAMGWFTRHLWTRLRRAERASEDMLARPSIDAYRASLEARWEFYRSLLAMGAVLPGVALILIGDLIRQPQSAPVVAATGMVFVFAIANGFRMHLPKARAIREQLAELDRL